MRKWIDLFESEHDLVYHGSKEPFVCRGKPLFVTDKLEVARAYAGPDGTVTAFDMPAVKIADDYHIENAAYQCGVSPEDYQNWELFTPSIGPTDCIISQLQAERFEAAFFRDTLPSAREDKFTHFATCVFDSSILKNPRAV